jgi:hypothetical protein
MVNVKKELKALINSDTVQSLQGAAALGIELAVVTLTDTFNQAAHQLAQKIPSVAANTNKLISAKEQNQELASALTAERARTAVLEEALIDSQIKLSRKPKARSVRVADVSGSMVMPHQPELKTFFKAAEDNYKARKNTSLYVFEHHEKPTRIELSQGLTKRVREAKFAGGGSSFDALVTLVQRRAKMKGTHHIIALTDGALFFSKENAAQTFTQTLATAPNVKLDFVVVNNYAADLQKQVNNLFKDTTAGKPIVLDVNTTEGNIEQTIALLEKHRRLEALSGKFCAVSRKKKAAAKAAKPKAPKV